ncbi:MAG: Uma2 family endonuclease [Anaerolineae bacterium]|nr:Uma2 family endonuclease [Anaerolineae bacterium]
MAEITWDLLIAADEAGIKLEIVNGLTTWETFPAARHQKAVYRIQQTIHRIEQSIKPGTNDSSCGCYHYADIYIRFPDGSFKRPDISVYCQDLEDSDEATSEIPEAVIEVVSKGYEAKDAEPSRLFYLSQGVKDVIVYDPVTQAVSHTRRSGTKRLVSPVTILLECGCQAIV